MKSFLIVLVLLGACILGFGFYRGWFHVGSENGDAKSNVTLSVDKEKFKEDEKTAVAKVQDAGSKMKDKVAGPGAKTADGTVVSVTGDKLTMSAKEEHGYTLTADSKVTCDGKVCRAVDLKPGMKVRVTTVTAESHAAIRVEALDNNPSFEKGA